MARKMDLPLRALWMGYGRPFIVIRRAGSTPMGVNRRGNLTPRNKGSQRVSTPIGVESARRSTPQTEFRHSKWRLSSRSIL